MSNNTYLPMTTEMKVRLIIRLKINKAFNLTSYALIEESGQA